MVPEKLLSGRGIPEKRTFRMKCSRNSFCGQKKKESVMGSSRVGIVKALQFW